MHDKDFSRLERKVDHIHQMLHLMSATLAAIGESLGSDNARLAAAIATLTSKSAQLQAALDANVPEQP